MSQVDRPAAPEQGTELHRLLDVPPGTDARLLRHTYEQQVGAALRSQDHARALQLSTALDQLPVTLRQQLYSRVHAHPALVPRRAGTDSGWRHRQQDGPEVGAEPRPGRPPGRRRLLAVLVAVPSLAAVAALALAHHSPSAQQIPVPVRSLAAPVKEPARTVPQAARTESNGYVRVECPPTAQGPGYSGYARRGQIVRCGNGAWPELPPG